MEVKRSPDIPTKQSEDDRIAKVVHALEVQEIQPTSKIPVKDQEEEEECEAELKQIQEMMNEHVPDVHDTIPFSGSSLAFSTY